MMKKTLRAGACILMTITVLAVPGCSDDSPDDVDLGVPVIRRVDGGNKSLSVLWTDEGAAKGYDLYYNETGDDPGPEVSAALAGIEEVTTEIDGLADGAAYSVWVRVSGGGQWSEGERGTTLRGGKALTEFRIGTIAGVIDETAKTVTVKMPYAETPRQAVTWVVSPGAAVSLKSAEDPSGVSVYTVCAENGEAQDYTVTKTVEGQGGIGMGYINESPQLTGGEARVSKTGTPAAVITASRGYERYQWYVDGELKGSAYNLTVKQEEYAPGKHYVSVEVEKGGVWYSQETFFIVE